MKRLLAFALLVLPGLLLTPRAQAQDEEYLQIYTQIQQADAQGNSGERAEALAKYREAQSALQIFQRHYPDWNPRVVGFRLNYVAARVAELSSRTPGVTNAPVAPSVVPPPATAEVAAELRAQLAVLQSQIQQLEANNSQLQAKLKEALTLQPAASDPRELARAQEQVRTLLKQNELLKATLAQTQPKPAMPQTKAPDDVKQALAEANRKLAEQTETVNRLSLERTALQSRLQSAGTNAGVAEALRAENALLKKQVADLKSAAPASGDLNRQLAQAQAKIAALTSAAEILRLEKMALESRVKQNAAAAPAVASVTPPVASRSHEAAQIRKLERERDDLQKQLTTANRELASLRGKAAGARITELSNQVAVLRARVSVLEAQPIPYTAEELVLFKRPEPVPAKPDTGQAVAKAPPPGAVALIAEAQRYFSAKDYDKAEQTYLQVLKQDESNVGTLANLAAIEVEQNHLDQAEQHIKQALANAPDDAYSLYILGSLKYRQEKYDDALTALSRAAQLDPRNPEIQNYLGVTLSHKGLRGPAETALRKAIELAPNYGKAHNNLAVIYITQEPPLPALARWHYQKALAAGEPHNPDLEKMLAQKESGSAKQ